MEIFFNLPYEMQSKIVTHTDIKTFLSLLMTSKYFMYVCDDIMKCKDVENRRTYFVEYIKKVNCVDQVFDALWNYSTKDNHGGYRDINSYISDTSDIEKIEFGNPHRLQLLKQYQDSLDLECYRINTYKNYLQIYFDNFVFPYHIFQKYEIDQNKIKIPNKKINKIFCQILVCFGNGCHDESINMFINNVFPKSKSMLAKLKWFITQNYGKVNINKVSFLPIIIILIKNKRLILNINKKYMKSKKCSSSSTDVDTEDMMEIIKGTSGFLSDSFNDEFVPSDSYDDQFVPKN